MLVPRSEVHSKQRKQRRKPIWLYSILVVVVLAGIYGAIHQFVLSDKPTSTTNASQNQNITDKSDGEIDSPAKSDIEADEADEDIIIDETPSRNSVSLSFVGDVMMGGKVAGILQQHGFEYPYQNIKNYLLEPDIMAANLEAPFTDRGEPAFKEYVFRVDPKAVPAFAQAGFDVVNLANNHILDYGEEGLFDTFDLLDQAGIQRVGAGRNSAEAYAPTIIEKNGIKVAMFGFSRVVPVVEWKAERNYRGVAETYDYTRAVAAIEKVRSEADLVVVMAHWGVEREELPADYQRELAHRYIDAGADLIVGSHPHVLQGFENYKGKWIAYSLGNFIFTTNSNELTWNSMILQAECGFSTDSTSDTASNPCEIQVVPILTKWAQPIVMENTKGEQLYQRLSELSFEAKVDLDGHVQKME